MNLRSQTLAGGLAILAIVCADSAFADPGHSPTQGIPARKLAQFTRCMSATPGVHVLRSQAELDELILQSCGRPAVSWDPIDFGRECVVFYYDGPRPSSGYLFELAGARLQRGSILLSLVEKSCGGGLFVTYPAGLYAVRRAPVAAQVEVSVEEVSCFP